MAAARRGATRPPARAAAGRPPVDLVFCAYNEARCIERKLANCLAIALHRPSVRIHAYSDGSSDGTAEAMTATPSDRVVISPERTGKSIGMNPLLAGCEGAIVLFTDANVSFSRPRSPPLPPFADPEVGCVCGQLVYVNAHGSRPRPRARSTGAWRSTSRP